MFGAWVPPCCLESIQLEQGVGDDELMLTELQKQASIVIAVANSVST